MMKVVMLSFLILLSAATMAQSDEQLNKNAAGSLMNPVHALAPAKKWSFNTFQGFSAGFSGWRGGYASIVSAPVGIQVNRTLTNNLFAFGAVSLAPSYIGFNRSFMNTDFNKTGFNNGSVQNNRFALYQRAEVGVGYTNDARTFQISGSIGVQRNPGGYPLPYLQNNGLINQLR